jgi:hypothetical protein
LVSTAYPVISSVARVGRVDQRGVLLSEAWVSRVSAPDAVDAQGAGVDRDAPDADGGDVSTVGGPVMAHFDGDARRSGDPDGLVTPRALRRLW